MRTLRVFASLLAFPCPFNEVGFPSVSPFWAVFNLAPFNNLRSDYPLDSRSIEWLILDRIRDTDMVRCLLRSDASASVAAVKLRSKVSRRDFDATQKVPVVPLLGNWSTWHRPNAVWVDVAFAKNICLGLVPWMWPCGRYCSVLARLLGTSGTTFCGACGHELLDVADECSQHSAQVMHVALRLASTFGH